MTTPRTACALVLCAALAGCTAGPDAAPDRAPRSTAPSTAPSTPAPTARPTDLADGEHHARVTAYDAGRATVTVDVVQFFTGEAAVDAAVEDGFSRDDVANDYYIRNAQKRLRTLTVAGDVRIVVNTLAFAENGSTTKDTVITPARLAAYARGGAAKHALFRLTLRNGVVVELREQYLP